MLIHPHQPATGAKNAWIIRPSNIASDIAKDITPPNMAKGNLTPDYPFFKYIIPSNIARNITPDDPLPKYCNHNRNRQWILRQITSQPNIAKFNCTMAPNHPFLNCVTAKGDRLAIISTPPKIFSSV